jgi:pimeloyl-ACP methyl ester carboxylesterase
VSPLAIPVVRLRLAVFARNARNCELDRDDPQWWRKAATSRVLYRRGSPWRTLLHTLTALISSCSFHRPRSRRPWGPTWRITSTAGSLLMNKRARRRRWRKVSPESFPQEVMLALNRDYMGPGVDFRPKLKDFARPVLIVTGRQDPLDPAVQYEIHVALKNSQLKLIPRCGHFPWIEQPEQFYRAVWDFLDGRVPAAKD